MPRTSAEPPMAAPTTAPELSLMSDPGVVPGVVPPAEAVGTDKLKSEVFVAVVSVAVDIFSGGLSVIL